MAKLTKQLKQSIIKIVISVVLLGLFVLGGFFLLYFLGFSNPDDMQIKLQEYIASKGMWAPSIFILISFLQVTFIPIPSTITILVGSFLFGPIRSLIYSFIGIILGSIVAFMLGRLIGKKFVVWIAGDKEKVDEYLNKMKGKETIALFFMFLFPFFPDDLLCGVAGITKMSLLTFVVIQVITRLVGIGTTLFFMSGEIIPYNAWGITIIVIASILALIVFYFAYKNADKIQDWFKNLFKKKN